MPSLKHETEREDHSFDVSLILLIYNPRLEKLMITLNSLLIQEGCNFEIIIADDGSKVNYEETVVTRMEQCGFKAYTYLKKEQNKGTIRNYMDALEVARGKYSYGISPGDCLHDKFVIRDFYQFCDKKQARFCFGDADYYTAQKGKLSLMDNKPKQPSHPTLFEDTCVFKQKIAFLFGNYILGVTYFRKTEDARKYIGLVSRMIEYAEDTPSTLFALADGIPIWHYPRKMVWYECGSGISTSGNDRWATILNNEYVTIYNELKEKHPKDAVIDAAYITKMATSKRKGIMRRTVKHPIITVLALLQKRAPVAINKSTQDEQHEFDSYMAELMKEGL